MREVEEVTDYLRRPVMVITEYRRLNFLAISRPLSFTMASRGLQSSLARLYDINPALAASQIARALANASLAFIMA